MFINPFLRKNHPFMDAESGVGGGTAAPQTTEPTATTGEGQTGSVTGTEGTSQTVTDPASQKPAQTPEQNAAFAEMGRKAEVAERKAAEAEQIRQRDINIAKKYGKDYDIYSEADIAAKWGGQGIKTQADFEAALQRQTAEEEARKIGLTPDVINQFIENHPAIQQAKQAQIEATLNAAFRELSSEYPDFKSMDDVYKLPSFDKITSLISRGYTLLDAYESANKVELRKQQAELARQATLNSVQGKGHLKGNGQGSEIDTTTVPDDVLAQYKAFNPKATMEQIKAHYKQSLK